VEEARTYRRWRRLGPIGGGAVCTAV